MAKQIELCIYCNGPLPRNKLDRLGEKDDCCSFHCAEETKRQNERNK